MGLRSIAWAKRLWALPFLSVLGPPSGTLRSAQSITLWAAQRRCQLRRGWSRRAWVVVGDVPLAPPRRSICYSVVSRSPRLTNSNFAASMRRVSLETSLTIASNRIIVPVGTTTWIM